MNEFVNMNNIKTWRKKKKTERRIEMAKFQNEIDNKKSSEVVYKLIETGSRIKVIGPGIYKGSYGYIIHLKENEYALCHLDLAGPKFIKINTDRLSLV